MAAALAFALALPPSWAQSARPKVGLVLGGGGARGAAHIGVLEVLEQLRVPVDCVAGTSMGALVAGAWAAGRSPAEMREELARADWDDMFQDTPDYAELPYRAKRQSQRFLPGTETGLTPQGAVGPPGVVLGQKIKLFFNQLVHADTGEPLIEQLPLPLSVLATDIGSGERVVFRDGSLTQAMRASMSVPGLMAPLEYRGRKLVDGGLVDNLPVREVRERCGAEVVIAVNVGSPPLPADQVTGLLSVTAQMVALLTEQNVSASLLTLTPRDLLLRPELGTITAADFARHGETADRGRAAALALAGRLSSLAVDEVAWADWRRRVAVRERAVPRVDEVQVAGLLRVDEALVRRQLRQRPGEPLDSAALARDLTRAFGDGHYERLDYRVQRVDGRTVLAVLPVEKSWGPDYLRMGVRLDSNISQGSTYLLRAGYQRTWLNRLGGELTLLGELGSSTGAALEWYQPLVPTQDWFADAQAEYRRERSDFWVLERRVAEYRTARARFDLTLGGNLAAGQWRAGWRFARTEQELETGLDIFSRVPQNHARGGALVVLDIDRLDRLYFPRSGWAVQGTWFHDDSREFSRLATELRLVHELPGWVLGARAGWTGATQGTLPLADAARLGGFLNLTGFASGQLLGDRVSYGHVRAERIIGRLPLGLRGDMRLGLALETGRVGVPYSVAKRDGLLHSVALYVGGETPLGPVYLGLGRGSGGATNGYLFIGTP